MTRASKAENGYELADILDERAKIEIEFVTENGVQIEYTSDNPRSITWASNHLPDGWEITKARFDSDGRFLLSFADRSDE